MSSRVIGKTEYRKMLIFNKISITATVMAIAMGVAVALSTPAMAEWAVADGRSPAEAAEQTLSGRGAAEIVVAADGSGDYKTLQEAINATPDYSHGKWTTIRVRSGSYREEVIIPSCKRCLKITGDDAGSTVITFGKYARQMWPGRDFEVGTSGSATVFVLADDVILENLTIENSAGGGKGIDQAVALLTDGDRVLLRKCRLLGNQDTIYTYGKYADDGGIKRNCFIDCYIEGTTDFIFGPSIAWFQDCTIHSKKDSYITAASTLRGERFGYVFKDCKLTAAKGVGKCWLGRPWGAYAKTVFINCELGAHILPEGWHDWERPGKPDSKANSFYAEYGSTGPGAVGGTASPRVEWSHSLSAEETALYTPANVFSRKGLADRDGKASPAASDWNPFE